MDPPIIPVEPNPTTDKVNAPIAMAAAAHPNPTAIHLPMRQFYSEVVRFSHLFHLSFSFYYLYFTNPIIPSLS